MPEFLQFAFSGLTVGAVYALVALGFTLVYNASDVVNFAQGEFVMLGGMVTVFISAMGVPLPLAALIAVIVAVAVGLLLYWLAIAPARGASAVTLVGINTATVMALAFGGSAAIGAVAGILVTPITLTSYDVGTLLALKGFAAAMLGGMGNPLGAVAGGLLLGLLESFGAGYISSTYKDAFAFIVILV